MMKKPSKKSQVKLADIKNDTPFEVKLGDKTYRCKYVKDKVVEDITYLWLKHDVDSEDESNILSVMKKNLDLPAKVCSMLILGSFWKIKLLHPFFWRYLRRNHRYTDYVDTITKSFEMMDIQGLAVSLASIRQCKTLMMKMTSKEMDQELSTAGQ